MAGEVTGRAAACRTPASAARGAAPAVVAPAKVIASAAAAAAAVRRMVRVVVFMSSTFRRGGMRKDPAGYAGGMPPSGCTAAYPSATYEPSFIQRRRSATSGPTARV